MLIRRVKSERSFQTLPPPPSPSPGFCGEEDSGFESKQLVSEKSTAAKRPAEDTAAEEEAKKEKRTHSSSNRIWSEEDEIAILRGLIDYKSERKSDPFADSNAFYDFIREDLQVEATRVQLVSKISKLKKKYGNSKGKRRTFSEPHEQRVHDLAKLIWGNERGRREKAVDCAAAAAAESGEGEELTAAPEKGGVMSVEERMLVAGREAYEIGGERVEGGEEWRKLRVEELELYRKEMEVRAAKSKVRIAQAKLVLDGIKRGKITFF